MYLKMDLFDKNNKTANRKFKKGVRKTNQVPYSKMVIRMVLPAEQTTAIAKSMLERQSKPTRTLIDLELQRMAEASKRRNRKSPGGKSESLRKKNNKRSRKEASSKEGKPRQNSNKLESITTIGEILS